MAAQCYDENGALITQYSFDDPKDTANYVYGTYDDATGEFTWDAREDVQLPPPTPVLPPVNPLPPIQRPVPPSIRVPRPCLPPKPPGP